MLMLLVLGLVASAQSTALRPYEGATHTYAWNGLQEGVGYEFYVAADASSSVIYDDGATGEFDFKTVPSGTIGVGDNAASVEIAWNNGASSHIYYVWLKVTAPSGCSNYRYVEVVPQVNRFDLLSENIPATNTVSCPATSTDDGFNMLASAYDAGTTTLHFLVKREYGTDNKLTPAVGDTYDWAFTPQLVVLENIPGLSNAIISVEGTNSGVIAANAGRYTVKGTDDAVDVTVTIQNAPGAERKVTLQVTLGAESNSNLQDSNPDNNNVTHTIQVMPLIGGMSGA